MHTVSSWSHLRALLACVYKDASGPRLFVLCLFYIKLVAHPACLGLPSLWEILCISSHLGLLPSVANVVCFSKGVGTGPAPLFTSGEVGGPGSCLEDPSKDPKLTPPHSLYAVGRQKCKSGTCLTNLTCCVCTPCQQEGQSCPLLCLAFPEQCLPSSLDVAP